VELAFVVGILLFGFVIGTAARFAVPGPDPMPIWLTTGIGVLGSAAGGLAARLFTDSAGSLLFAFGGAVGLVIAYRHFVQGRGITGPQAKSQPTRGWGLRPRKPATRHLQMLGELRDAGIVTPEEYDAKRAALSDRAGV
jgi:uncharacterized membrane protein YeaQ/YmgE (transglycosylase-associated protein family)